MSRKKSVIGIFPGLPTRIRKIRGELTQKEFGEILGVAQGTVNKYEKGIILPGEDVLKRISAYGEVPLECLLHGEPKELPEPEEAITIESPTVPLVLHAPYVFGGIDIGTMTQIIETVEELLSKRKKPLKPVKKALLISLLYDRFQSTGQPLDQATLKEYLRRVD